MRKINQTLLEWLEIWGDWREKGVPGLTYPSMTQEARLVHSPGRSTKQMIGPHYEFNHIAQGVEDAYKVIEPDLQVALWVRYVGRFPRPKCAESTGKSLNQWDWLLEKSIRTIGRELRLIP